MRLHDLRLMVEAMEAAGVPEEAEVRLATQPSYPLESSVAGVHWDVDDGVVYVLEGSQLGYGQRHWWDEPFEF